MKKIFLIITYCLLIVATAAGAQEQYSYIGQRYDSHSSEEQFTGTGKTQYRASALPQQKPVDLILRDFLNRQAALGSINEKSIPQYERFLSSLPLLQDMLYYLQKKQSDEQKTTLESLVQRKSTIIGPFIYFSKIRDYDRQLIRHVDLRTVINKIQNQSFHKEDGWKVFNNYERRLPRKPKGYYHEVRVPTAGLKRGGPQRIVYGDDGEMYYTPDHYESFRKLEVKVR